MTRFLYNVWIWKWNIFVLVYLPFPKLHTYMYLFVMTLSHKDWMVHQSSNSVDFDWRPKVHLIALLIWLYLLLINSKLVFNMNVTLLKYYMIACTSTFCKFNDTFSRKFRRLCIFKNSFHQFGIYLNLKFNNMIFVCMLCTIILVLWPRKFCIYNIIISIWYQLMTSKGDEIHQLRWWNS